MLDPRQLFIMPLPIQPAICTANWANSLMSGPVIGYSVHMLPPVFFLEYEVFNSYILHLFK